MDLHKPTVYMWYILLTSLALIFAGMAAVSKRETRNPGRLQGTAEWMMEGLRKTFMSALGEGGERHLPLIFTLGFYVLFCNLLELIPLFGAATASPSITIGLGIIVFVYVQYVGITSKGFVNYAKHFLGPIPLLFWLFLIIEIIGELVKPFSLGMRLFGNIYAEDIINELAADGGKRYFIPFQFFVYFLQIFTGIIQAFIFALLTCAYIGLMAENHDEDGHHGDKDEQRDEHVAATVGSIGGRVVESAH